MAINTWAIAAKYPTIRQVGLCHSVQGTAEELARDLDLPVERDPLPLRRHQPHGVLPATSRKSSTTAAIRDLYPALRRGYAEGRFPKPSSWNPRCPNKVRYEMMTRLGYFVTESSEHFAEYTPWFIKRDRPDLIERFGIPLDEYPKRCVEQIARWSSQAKELPRGRTPSRSSQSREYASEIMNSVWTGDALGHLRQRRQPRPDHLAARGLRRRGALPRRPQRHPAHPRRRPAAAARRADAHQHQRAGADRRGADRGEPRAHLPRRDARPAHRRRARPRPDSGSSPTQLLARHGDWLPEWARPKGTRTAAE